MHILLTRPRGDCEPLAAALRALGDEVTIEPMLDIVETGDVPSFDGVQAILATSANGIRALAAARTRRDLPVFAVGDATAQAARAAGYTRVESAQGASAALYRPVTEQLKPGDGALLHVRGRDAAGDLAGRLEANGFAVRTAILYAAEAARALSPAVRERIAVGEIDAVLFFSPRTARTFVNLIGDANMEQACGAIDAVCLSPAVAEAASAVAWRAVHVAASPDQAAMMEERTRMQNSKDSDPPARPAAGPGASATDGNPKDAKPGGGNPGDDKATAVRSKIPSTLEKAVAKDAEGRRAEDAKKADMPAETKPPAKPGSRSRAGMVVGALVLLLVLAGAWIFWPAWGPTLPGWLRAAIAPVMDAGRGDAAVKADELAGRIAGLEREIASLKARPRVDPARVSAIGETARAAADRIETMAADIAALRQAVSSPGPSEEVAALSRRLGEAESRIAAITAAPGSKAAVEALDTLRTQSSARMTVLERENNALRKLIAMQDRRLAALEERPAGVAGATRASALVIAVGQLREAARGTAPFGEALRTVTALAADDAALRPETATLKPLAATGVPDLTALRLQFDGIARRIATEAYVPKGEGWFDRTLQQLSRLVTVRRSGSEAAARDDENGRVARAELRLAAGDLAGAVAALDGMAGVAAKIAAPWLEQARLRLAVDGAIGRLFAEALRRTGAGAKDATGG